MSTCDNKIMLETGETFDVDIEFSLDGQLDILANYPQVACILYIKESNAQKIFGTFALDINHVDLSTDYTWTLLTITPSTSEPDKKGTVSVSISPTATLGLISNGSRDIYASITFKSPTSVVKQEDIKLPNVTLSKSVTEGLV